MGTSFLLFAYDYYYPNGGPHDCLGAFPSLTDAQQFFHGTHEVAEIAVVENQKLTIVSVAYCDTKERPPRIVWNSPEESEVPQLSSV